MDGSSDLCSLGVDGDWRVKAADTIWWWISRRGHRFSSLFIFMFILCLYCLYYVFKLWLYIMLIFMFRGHKYRVDTWIDRWIDTLTIDA